MLSLSRRMLLNYRKITKSCTKWHYDIIVSYKDVDHSDRLATCHQWVVSLWSRRTIVVVRWEIQRSHVTNVCRCARRPSQSTRYYHIVIFTRLLHLVRTFNIHTLLSLITHRQRCSNYTQHYSNHRWSCIVQATLTSAQKLRLIRSL